MGYSILFLDDERDLGEPLTDILRREGYEVDYFYVGKEAVEAGQAKKYDLLLLDIMLKNFNVSSFDEVTCGREVARLINQVNPTPFIFLSGRSDPFDVVSGLDMGATRYITKPYDLPVLLAKLRCFFRDQECCSRTNGDVQATEIIVGDIHIDLINRRVFLNGKEVFIQDRPLEILIYLARNQGRSVPKDELLKAIWGQCPTDEIITNNVEVVIGRLRSTIGSEYIKTIRGQGYSLQV